jgi:type I restriction enzyme M protein
VLAFEERLVEIEDGLKIFSDRIGAITEIGEAQRQPLTDALAELTETESAYETDRAFLLDALATFGAMTAKIPPNGNADQHATRHAFAPLAERIKGLVEQIDLLYKLAARAAQLAQDLASDEPVGANSFARDAEALSRRLKPLDAERKTAVEQLELAVYFHRQIVRLQDRFPEA